MPIHPNEPAKPKHVILTNAAAKLPPAQNKSNPENLLDFERSYEESHSFNDFNEYQQSFENPCYARALSSILDEAWHTQFSTSQEPDFVSIELAKMQVVSSPLQPYAANSDNLNIFISEVESVTLTGHHAHLSM